MTTIEAMNLAIQEAKKGYGFVAPNPVVGCVILDRNGNLLSSGFHAQVGKDHAEIDALKKIKDPQALEGAHVIVTLEPCSHFGRTPPCADQLAELPIKKLTYGLLDPNPQVSGRGIEKLKAKGIQIEECTELRDELEDLAETFLYNMRHKKAFVALKVATSLDGSLAFNTGESQWITSENAREEAHALRGRYDAVLVGSGTVMLDNPKLDVRHENFKTRAPNKLVILDPEAKTHGQFSHLNVAKVRPLENIIVVTAKANASKFQDVPTLVAPVLENGQIDLKELSRLLYEQGITSVFVEGGAETLSGFVNQQAAQRLFQFIAPKIFGAGASIAWTKNVAYETMKFSVQLKNVKYQVCGTDVLLSGRLFS